MNLALAEALCCQFEGLRASPYLCPAGIPTIGYGSTYYSDGRKVMLVDAAVDEPTARALLRQELEHTYLPGQSSTLRSIWEQAGSRLQLSYGESIRETALGRLPI